MTRKLIILTAVTMVCVCALCLIYQNNSIKEANTALETYAKENMSEGRVVRVYEMLIKKTAAGIGPGAYEMGDIIKIEPEGYDWTAVERSDFYIVKARLTREQAELLDDPKVKTTDARDRSGNYIVGVEYRRKYKIGNIRNLASGDFITMDDIVVK